ncbi:MAG: LCP family protein [Candidatus Caldatribacteriota bacterium]|nr:LCP family protein [Candidatus Caldatribacteriota bacterium]
MKRKKKLIIFSVLFLILLIFTLKYFSIFPFSSNLLSFKRINILIVGCDEIENHGRADTIAFLSVSPKTKDALILSVPRDLRVDIPGRGMDKINHAFAFGGEELLIKTVSLFLDLPVHFYAVADFNGFVEIIDELGGVEVNVEKEMHYVDKAGGVDINLYPGKQLLDGEKALQYIRFRHDKLGDLGRIERQQKLALSLLKKVMHFDKIGKIPPLIEEIKSYTETNIKIQDVITLANLFKGVSEGSFKIETVQGDPVYIEGISYLQPDKEKVQKRIKSLIYGSNAGMKIEVLNGSGASGIAHKIARKLELQGFEIVDIDNATNFNYEKTKIVVYSKEVNINNEFKKLFNNFEIIKKYKNQFNLDLTIILGKDMEE